MQYLRLVPTVTVYVVPVYLNNTRHGVYMWHVTYPACPPHADSTVPSYLISSADLTILPLSSALVHTQTQSKADTHTHTHTCIHIHTYIHTQQTDILSWFMPPGIRYSYRKQPTGGIVYSYSLSSQRLDGRSISIQPPTVQDCVTPWTIWTSV